MPDETLAAYPVPRIRVACAKCPRRGDYSVARLIASHGPDMRLLELREMLSADCPKRNPHAVPLDWCGAYFAEPQGVA